MKEYFQRTLLIAPVIWIILTTSVIISSLLYAFLELQKLSVYSGLLISIIVLVGLILSSILLIPRRYLSSKEGIHVEDYLIISNRLVGQRILHFKAVVLYLILFILVLFILVQYILAVLFISPLFIFVGLLVLITVPSTILAILMKHFHQRDIEP
jgi:hypothetical protein